MISKANIPDQSNASWFLVVCGYKHYHGFPSIHSLLLPIAGIYYRRATVEGTGIFVKDAEETVVIWKDVASTHKVGWVVSDKVCYDMDWTAKKKTEFVIAIQRNTHDRVQTQCFVFFVMFAWIA